MAADPLRTLDFGCTVYSIDFSPDGRYLVGVDDSNSLRVWEVGKWGEPVILPLGDLSRVVRFAPQGRLLVGTFWNPQLQVWDIQSRKRRRVWRGYSQEVTSVTASSDGRLIAGGDDGGTVIVHDSRLGLRRFRSECEFPVTSVSLCGHSLLAVAAGKRVVVWRVFQRSPEHTINPPDEYFDRVLFSPSGKKLVVACSKPDFVIRIWDVRTWKCDAVVNTGRRSVKDMAFTPDGRLLTAVTHDGSAFLWDTASYTLRSSFIAHDKFAGAVTIDPGCKMLATSGHDKKVRLWKISALIKNGITIPVRS